MALILYFHVCCKKLRKYVQPTVGVKGRLHRRLQHNAEGSDQLEMSSSEYLCPCHSSFGSRFAELVFLLVLMPIIALAW